MNLSEGGVTDAADVPEGVNTRTINGIIVPDGTSASVAFFNAGYYLNELEFTVGEDGVATIGLRLDKTIGSIVRGCEFSVIPEDGSDKV